METTTYTRLIMWLLWIMLHKQEYLVTSVGCWPGSLHVYARSATSGPWHTLTLKLLGKLHSDFSRNWTNLFSYNQNIRFVLFLFSDILASSCSYCVCVCVLMVSTLARLIIYIPWWLKGVEFLSCMFWVFISLFWALCSVYSCSYLLDYLVKSCQMNSWRKLQNFTSNIFCLLSLFCVSQYWNNLVSVYLLFPLCVN